MAFNIITIDALTAIGPGVIDGTTLLAISHGAATYKATSAELLAWMQTAIDLAYVPYDPTGNTYLTATDLAAVLAQIEANLVSLSTGVNPFDQDLNTFNSPTFATIGVTGTVIAQAFDGDGRLLLGTPVHQAAVDPTIDADSDNGFTTGSLWHNTTSDSLFSCTDKTVGAAVWAEISSGAGGSENPFDQDLNTFNSPEFKGTGWISKSTSSARSIMLGTGSGNSTMTGDDNFIVGDYAGAGLTSGGDNFIFGPSAAEFLEDGSDNIIMGYRAARSSTDLSVSVAIGYWAGENTQGTSEGVYIGYLAGNTDEDGTQNIAIGSHSGQNHTNGTYYNISLGIFAGAQMDGTTRGYQNISIGYYSGYLSTDAFDNVAIGYQALRNNQAGGNNVGIGVQAGWRNGAGLENIYIGNYAGGDQVDGVSNVCIGEAAGSGVYQNSSFSYATMIGANAGSNNTTGSKNICIGYNAQLADGTASNLAMIGGTGADAVKVGIGNNAPVYEVDVVGDVNVTGDFRVNGVPISFSDNFVKAFPAGEAITTGDICVLASDGKMYKASATVVTLSSGLLGLALADAVLDESIDFLLYGELGGYTSLTPGSIFYVSLTSGAMTTAQPTQAGEIVRVIGYAFSATTILFDPSKTWIERV